MKLFLSLVIFALNLPLVLGQQFQQITPLSPTLGESSGLLFWNGKIITHTDSQGEAALYEVDSITGDPTRKVIIANASNVDWEDITSDSTYIYIGDIGNNGGNRTNLRIYRISQADYWNTPNDTVFADTLNYAYADQTSFNYLPEGTNYDCEALAAMGDSLYLFTKNWVNAKTYVYVLPKIPGNYIVTKSDSILVQGLITGADYHQPSDRLILCGYTQFPFAVEMNNPLVSPLHQRPFVRYNLPNTSLIQLEAIVTISANSYYLTAETFQAIAVRLYRLSGKNGVSGLDDLSEDKLLVYPNPTSGKIYFSETTLSEIEVINLLGEVVYQKELADEIDLSFLPKGVYFLKGDSLSTDELLLTKIILF